MKGNTTMELQDLKDRWNDYDRKLDANLRLNTRVLREVCSCSARSSGYRC
jgi:hypothetical protein